VTHPGVVDGTPSATKSAPPPGGEASTTGGRIEVKGSSANAAARHWVEAARFRGTVRRWVGDCLLSVGLSARRRFDRIFVSARRSLEPSILLDRQCSMENIAFNDTGAIYLDAVGADGALKVAANC
jgi:hypothetical protein